MSDPIEERMTTLFSTHGKTIVGTTQVWGHLTLEFDDGSSFTIVAKSLPRSDAAPWLEYEASEKDSNVAL